MGSADPESVPGLGVSGRTGSGRPVIITVVAGRAAAGPRRCPEGVRNP